MGDVEEDMVANVAPFAVGLTARARKGKGWDGGRREGGGDTANTLRSGSG